MSKSWYSIKNLADSGKTTISIHDEIGGWGVMARDFIRDLSAVPPANDIVLSVHSPGGDVFEALAIFHTLARIKDRVTARVEGLAASAASLIIMAAGKIEIPANAYLMIHNPWSYSIGDAGAMQAMADMLKKIEGSLVSIYSDRTGKPGDEIEALLAAETWMTGSEAVAAGFADAVLDPMPAFARVSDEARARFARLPAVLDKPAPLEAPLVFDACQLGGFPELAEPLIRSQSTASDVRSRLEAASEIVALATAAGRPVQEAMDMIREGLGVEAARARLIAARAAGHQPVDSHRTDQAPAFLVPKGQAAPPAPAAAPQAAKKNPLDITSIYAARQAVDRH